MLKDIGSSLWEDQVAFRCAFSPVHAHNHIVRAYRAADMHRRTPPPHLMWLLSAISVPAKVRMQIDAEQVAEELLEGLMAAKSILSRRREALDVPVEHVIHHTNGRNGKSSPYEKLYPGIAVAQLGRPAYSSAWEYTFNPYEVGDSMIRDYTRIIEGGSTVKLTGFTKVARLHQKALAYEMSSLLIADAFRGYR